MLHTLQTAPYTIDLADGETAVKAASGDTYSAHVGGCGDVGTVSCTVQIHVWTQRVINDWVGTHGNIAILGESVASLRGRGYSVTAFAR